MPNLRPSIIHVLALVIPLAACKRGGEHSAPSPEPSGNPALWANGLALSEHDDKAHGDKGHGDDKAHGDDKGHGNDKGGHVASRADDKAHGNDKGHGGHIHWAYAGEGGPTNWGELEAGFSACKTGKSQSPIDIGTHGAAKSATPIETHYASPLPLQIFNNGHTVQVQNSTAAWLESNGDSWKLLQFHFHSPSEHALDGKLLDLELHLVHKNDKGELAVLGLLFKKGKENPLLAPVFDNMPSEVSKEAKPVGGVHLALQTLVPLKAHYYGYAGSLTTPPCSEGVRWHVLADIGEVSGEQIERFRAVTHGDTNRPVQPLFARKVASR